jgi:hypothetical protein
MALAPRSLFILLAAGMTAAGLTSLAGGGAGTKGEILGHCIAPVGNGWAPAKCEAPTGDQPAPVPVDQVPAAGELGARGAAGPLTVDEVRRLWVAHGGQPAQADIAAAVATAESGRRPDAINVSNSNGSIDRGLFQMNSIHGDCSTFDLDENVRCAVQLQQAGGWRHWVSYQSGVYRRYL